MNLIHRFPDSTQCTPAVPLDLRCAGICPVPSSAWSAEHWDWGAEHQNWGAEPRNGNTKHQNGWKGVGEPLPWLQPKGPQAAGGGRGWEWGKEKIPTRFTEQTSQEQPLCAAFQRAHGNGTRPEPFPPGTANTVPSPSPARPGLPRSHCLVPRADPCSRTVLPCPQGHVWHRCHKD